MAGGRRGGGEKMMAGPPRDTGGSLELVMTPDHAYINRMKDFPIAGVGCLAGVALALAVALCGTQGVLAWISFAAAGFCWLIAGPILEGLNDYPVAGTA